MISAEEIVEFRVSDGTKTRDVVGTTLTNECNGIILVAIHDHFAVGMDGPIFDKNLLCTMAVRVGAINKVRSATVPRTDNTVGVVFNNWQGEKR